MRKVVRSNKPASLSGNADQWTNDLMFQLLEKNWEYNSVKDSFKNKYRQQDIKETLEKMYCSRCCYCETVIGISDYAHIEHLKPKALFPYLSFDWENLHLGCQACNTPKNAKWNEQDPILDATVDDVDEHLQLIAHTGEYVSLTDRGQTTIEHTKMNRKKLAEARQNFYLKLWRDYNCVTDPLKIEEFKQNIQSDSKIFSYPSVIEQFLRKIG